MSNPYAVRLKPVGSPDGRPKVIKRSVSDPSYLVHNSAKDDDALEEELAKRRASLKPCKPIQRSITPTNMLDLSNRGRTPYARHTSSSPTFHVVLKPTMAKGNNGEAEEEQAYYFDLDYQFSASKETQQVMEGSGYESESSQGQSDSASNKFGTRLKPSPQVLDPGVQTKTYQIDLNQRSTTGSDDPDALWIPSGLIENKRPRSIMELKLKPDSTAGRSKSNDNGDDDNPSEIEMLMRHIVLIPNQDGGPMRRKITSQTSVFVPLPIQPSPTSPASDLSSTLPTSPTAPPVLLEIQLGELHQVDADHSKFRIQMTYVDPDTQEPILDMDVMQEDLVVEWKHVLPDKEVLMENKDSAPRMPARRRVEEDESSDVEPDNRPDPASMMKVDKAPSMPRRRRGSASGASTSTPPPPTTTTTTPASKSSRTSKNKRGALGKKLPKKFRVKKLRLKHLPTVVEEEDDEDENENDRARGDPLQIAQKKEIYPEEEEIDLDDNLQIEEKREIAELQENEDNHETVCDIPEPNDDALKAAPKQNDAPEPIQLTEKKRRDILMWWSRMGNPSKDVMKRKVSKLSDPDLDITVEDVDALPWLGGGMMLDIKVMNERFLSGE